MRETILPNSWKNIKSNEIFDSISDRSHNGQLQVLSATQDRGIVPRTKMDIDIKYDEKALPTYKKVVPGNFVIHLRSFQGGLAYSDVEGIISPAYTILKPKIEICDYYYKYLFQSVDYIKRLNSAVYGIRDGKQISYDTFGVIKIPLPPLSEQQAIAEILTTADKLIVVKERLIAGKQKQKQWLIQNLMTGKLRLSGFNGEWKRTYLRDVLTEKSKQKGEQVLEICSVAVREGVINQEKHLGRSYAAQDTFNYSVVSFGDIVYTKSPTGDFPLGIIKQNQIKHDVAVSPLYGIYTPISYIIGLFLHIFFSSYINTNNYLKKIVQKGAKNTINVNNQCFLMNTLSLPIDTKEQQAIANVLTTADREIELLKKELEQQKLIKKYLMQKLLTGKIRVKEAKV